MHAPFVTHRPSLPLGYTTGDLPPVQRPLHSDEWIEAYLLDHTTDSDLVLVRLRGREAEAIREWWRILGPNVITELGSSAVRLRGQWWPDQHIEKITDAEWRSLLAITVNAFEKAYEKRFRPYLKPSLSWFSQETSMLVPLCAAQDAEFTQDEALRDLAVFLISSSTGIDAPNVASASQASKSWNKCIPADLFDVLIRCLPNQGNDQISCFEEFEDRISGKSRNRPTPPIQNHKASGKAGLSNIAGMHDLKEWLRKEILGPLQNPQIYEKYRIGVPNGILFYGPPGCGKTYLARRVAEELATFFRRSNLPI